MNETTEFWVLLHDNATGSVKQLQHLRIGQAYFNALSKIRPDIAETICGTDSDPYFSDLPLPQFFATIMELLDKSSE